MVISGLFPKCVLFTHVYHKKVEKDGFNDEKEQFEDFDASSPPKKGKKDAKRSSYGRDAEESKEEISKRKKKQPIDGPLTSRMYYPIFVIFSFHLVLVSGWLITVDNINCQLIPIEIYFCQLKSIDLFIFSIDYN